MNRVIEITRIEQYANKARSIGIYINNKKVDTLKDGETKRFELDSDENEIYAKIDWCKTKRIKTITTTNKTTRLELGSILSGWRLYLALYYVTFKPSNYLYLKIRK